ncbi:hypothetical protein D3C81_1457710 [compost metagenome]
MRASGTSSSTLAKASSTNAAIRDSGTETSHLMLPPVRVCASEISSRMRQKVWTSDKLAATAASNTSPWPKPDSRISISVALRLSASVPEVSSTSTIQSWRSCSGAATLPRYSSTSSSAGREISSKALTAWPERRLASPSSATAAAGSLTATRATAVLRGCGISLSTAPVMMPSVPSAPINRCLRS